MADDAGTCVAEPTDAEIHRRLLALPTVLAVRGKADLLGPKQSAAPVGGDGGPLAVSGVTLAGVAQLRQAVRRRLGLAQCDPQEPMAFTQRQATLLLAAADALDRDDASAARTFLEELLHGTRPG
jgi:tRNA U34 5-carboxymethylaminomethyl modifying GTPase MnmE/TrmE